MEELISVIVPIYNVENYLRRCVNSIINQIYKNLEIILVDDGSTDNSGKICDEYAKTDNRIIVVHKKNGGVSDARNKGVEIVKGKYITFVDPDDYISEDYIEYLYNILVRNNANMSICNVKKIFKNIKYELQQESFMKVLKPEEVFENILLNKGIEVAVYGKLYDIKLFDKIKFPFGKTYEDTAVIYKLIDKCDEIAYGNKECYYYIARVGSISKQKRYNKNEESYIEFTNEMLKYINNKYPKLQKQLKRFYVYSNFRILRMLVFTKPRQKDLENKIVKNIKQYQKEVILYKDTSLRDKFAIITLNIGKPIFKITWYLYIKITGRII